jgi:prevent-host-death family protein
MKIAPIADVKTHLSRMVKECREQLVVVTRNGRPAAMLVAVDEGDDLERLVLAGSLRFRRLLDAAAARASERGVPHDRFWRRVQRKRKARTAPRARKR